MKTRYLGNSGLQVSLVGLGCNNFGGRLDLDGSCAVVHKALDAGINLFDTADIYGNSLSEEYLGKALASRRKDIVLATKFGMPMDREGKKQGGSRRYIMSAVEDSLRRLQTDWIDLYQIHQLDANTPIEETLRALDDLVHQGKVRYIGCSNFPSWRVVEALWTSKSLGIEKFISCQDQYSLLARGIEAELLPAAETYGMGVLPFFPLASGLLTGKYKRGQAMPEGARLTKAKPLADMFLVDKNWPIVEKLEAFCATRGHSMLELAFSWLAARPSVSSVIAGATKPEQIDQNIKAVEWAIPPEDMAEIDKITSGK